MRKILGVLAVVLLVCATATATAKPQMATTIGNTSAFQTTIGSDIIVIFDQTALFMGSDIGVIFDQTAIFMDSEIGVQVDDVATVDSSGIFVSIHQVANFNGPATKALEVSDAIDVSTMRQTFDSAISILFNQARLAIFMENTEVDQLLKGPRSIAVIHQPRSMMHC